MNTKKTLLGSALVLYFVIAFEVLIMISPFAGFFYSIMNPVLLKFAAHPSTRWLSAFFLPHMVLPQDPFLRFVRVMGSVLFAAGMAVFLACAAQIYTAKLRKKGAVLRGLYSVVRHPQYLALVTAGLGLAILWPRFLTLVLWLVMALVYYVLARDEERRMLQAHESTYRPYMKKTGMFLPQGLERLLTPSSVFGKVVFTVIAAGTVIGSAFLLRWYTVDHLTLWTNGKDVAAVAILLEDGFKMDHRLPDILSRKEIRQRMEEGGKYLVYFIPQNYIMQGMIADTGGDWKLYNQHHSLSLIMDWIINPFGHLRGGHQAMHAGHHDVAGDSGAVIRRLIVLSASDGELHSPSDLFGVNTLRVPLFMADVDVHTATVLEVKELPHGSGWGTVPTPVF